MATEQTPHFVHSLEECKVIAACTSIEVLVVNNYLTWMSPIADYLSRNTLSVDEHEVQRVMARVVRYVLSDGVLYRRSVTQPLLHYLPL